MLYSRLLTSPPVLWFLRHMLKLGALLDVGYQSLPHRGWHAAGLLLLLASLLLSPFLAVAEQPCVPTNKDFELIEEQRTTNSDNSTHIPLILIHGIHGSAKDSNQHLCADDGTYWHTFMVKFCGDDANVCTSGAFKDKYKLYTFRYVSDVYGVDEIAVALRDAIDKKSSQFADKQLVIVAHSMGGLVARSYMMHWHRSGSWAGTQGGDHVSKLITLATPHHGTPIANIEPRVITDDYKWKALFSGLDIYYWEYNGCARCTLDTTAPNRRDLLFDNFDHRWDDQWSEYVNNAAEHNTLLEGMGSKYDDRIIAYYGYIGHNPEIDTWGDPEEVQNLLDYLGFPPWRIADYFKQLSDHSRLNILSVLLERSELNSFKEKISYVNNDGMVPKTSAAFNGHSVRKQVECPGFNHLQMKGDAAGNKQCKTSLTLLESVAEDLDLTARKQQTKVLSIQPSPVAFGNVSVGSSADVTLSLYNYGNSNLTINFASFSGTDQNQFSLVGSIANTSIGANQSRDIKVRFVPTLTGRKTATLSFDSDADPGSDTTVSLSGTGYVAACSYNLSPTQVSFPTAGGNQRIQVSTASGCYWSVTSEAEWAAADAIGNGTGSFNVVANANPNALRMTNLDFVAGSKIIKILVTEDGKGNSCIYSLSESQANYTAAGGDGSFVIATSPGCSWSASSSQPFVTITSAKSGTGSQTISYSVTSNPNSSIRFALITIQGGNQNLTYTVSQDAAAAPCAYSLSTTRKAYSADPWVDTVQVQTSSACAWSASTTDSWITLFAPTSGKGSNSIGYQIAANQLSSQRVGSIVVSGAGWSQPVTVWQQPPQAGSPKLVIDVQSVQMGNVLLGTTNLQTIALRNAGTLPLQISAVYMQSGSADFLPQSWTESPIQAGGSGEIVIAYTPSTTGMSSATVRVVTNDPLTPTADVSLTGNGILPSQAGIDFTWANKYTLPDAKNGAASATIGDKVYLIGGSPRTRTYRYDPTNNSYTRLADAPYGIDSGGAGVIGGKIYAIGDPGPNAVQIYDPGADNWTLGPPLPTQRDAMAVCVAAGRLYAISGLARDNSGPSHIVEAYDPATGTWTRKADIPTAREWPAVAVVNDLIYVIGGRTGNIFAVNEVYDPAADKWSVRESIPTARSSATAAVNNAKIVVIGGFNGTKSLSVVEEFDPLKVGTEAWAHRNPLLADRMESAAATVNGKTYVIGGRHVDNSPNGKTYDQLSIEEGTRNASPVVSFAYGSVSFPDTPLGTIGELELTIQNTGNANLTVALDGCTSYDSFSFYAMPAVLSGGQSGVIRVRFTPPTVGVHSTTCQINTNDPENPTLAFSLSGKAISLPDPPSGSIYSSDVISITGIKYPSEFSVSDGKAYVTHNAPGGLTVVDLATQKTLGNVDFTAYPTAHANQVAVANNRAFIPLSNIGGGGILSVTNLNNWTPGYYPAGVSPYGVAWDRGRVWVTDSVAWSNGNPAALLGYEADSLNPTASVPVPASPNAVVADDTNNQIYVTNYGCQSCGTSGVPPGLTIVDPVGNQVVASVITREPSSGMAVVGNTAYVTTSGVVEVVDLGTNRIVKNIPVAPGSWGLAQLASYLLVPSGSGTITVISTQTNAVTQVIQAGNGTNRVATDPATGIAYVLSTADHTITALNIMSRSFDLSCDPLVLNSRGKGTTSCTGKSKDSYSGSVAFSCDKLPPMATCAFNPASVSVTPGHSATTLLTFSFPDSSSSGVYEFSVVGSDKALSRSTLSSFRWPPDGMSVSVATSGSGTVVSGDGFINCGDRCNHIYSPSEQVILTALPASGSTVGDWSGCDSVQGSRCLATITSDRSVHLTFNPVQLTLKSLTLSPDSVKAGNISIATVAVVDPAPAGGLAIALSSEKTDVAQVPAVVLILAGRTSVSFAVRTGHVRSKTTAVIKALANAGEASAILTVAPQYAQAGPGQQETAKVDTTVSGSQSDASVADATATGLDTEMHSQGVHQPTPPVVSRAKEDMTTDPTAYGSNGLLSTQGLVAGDKARPSAGRNIPVSIVTALPPLVACRDFTVQWSGLHVKEGIQDYSIYVSDNGGQFVPWLLNTSMTSAVFHGRSEHRYRFYSLARDLVGNTESEKDSAEASTKVAVDQVCEPTLP